MTFKKRKQASAWCDAHNKLPAQVEILIARHCEKLRKCGDTRCYALAKGIWPLQKQFAVQLNSLFEEIRKRESEFTLCQD